MRLTFSERILAERTREAVTKFEQAQTAGDATGIILRRRRLEALRAQIMGYHNPHRATLELIDGALAQR
jgi:hypothetical protein